MRKVAGKLSIVKSIKIEQTNCLKFVPQSTDTQSLARDTP